jgi:hypothetical protein
VVVVVVMIVRVIDGLSTVIMIVWVRHDRPYGTIDLDSNRAEFLLCGLRLLSSQQRILFYMVGVERVGGFVTVERWRQGPTCKHVGIT